MIYGAFFWSQWMILETFASLIDKLLERQKIIDMYKLTVVSIASNNDLSPIWVKSGIWSGSGNPYFKCLYYDAAFDVDYVCTTFVFQDISV